MTERIVAFLAVLIMLNFAISAAGQSGADLLTDSSIAMAVRYPLQLTL